MFKYGWMDGWMLLDVGVRGKGDYGYGKRSGNGAVDTAVIAALWIVERSFC